MTTNRHQTNPRTNRRKRTTMMCRPKTTNDTKCCDTIRLRTDSLIQRNT